MLGHIRENTLELIFDQPMLAPSVLYPQEMYEQMFEMGIRSGRNDVVYYQGTKTDQTGNNDEIEDYDKEKERLGFKWRVINHTDKSMEFKIDLKNKETISKIKVDKLIL